MKSKAETRNSKARAWRNSKSKRNTGDAARVADSRLGKAGADLSGDELERIAAILHKLRLLLLAIFLVVFGIFLMSRYLINYSFVRDYKGEKFDTAKEEILLHLNFPEGYVPEYNIGCVYYEQGDYDAAMAIFQSALDRHPVHNRFCHRECSVRVNLALSMLHKIDYEHLDTEEKIKEAIIGLKVVRSVLTSNGCACEPVGQYYGHSREAEYLKAEIDNLIQQLENPQSSGGGGDGGQSRENESSEIDENKKKPDESKREKDIRKKLEDEKGEARREMTDKGNGSRGGEWNYGDEHGGRKGNNW